MGIILAFRSETRNDEVITLLKNSREFLLSREEETEYVREFWDCKIQLAGLAKKQIDGSSLNGDEKPKVLAKLIQDQYSEGLFEKEEFAHFKPVYDRYISLRQRLIFANVGICGMCAKKYRRHNRVWQDILQCANMGLVEGVDRFDPSVGVRISTYVSWWVSQSIQRCVFDQGTGGLSSNHMVLYQFQMISREEHRLTVENGVTPPDSVVAKNLGMSEVHLRGIRSIYESKKSLSAKDGEFWVGDMLEDPRSECGVANSENSDVAKKLLSVLPKRHRQLVELRYGLDGTGEERAMADVGKIVGLSKERVRKILKEAVQIIRRKFNITLGAIE